jgi:molecular chaperone DnaK (HSP70)
MARGWESKSVESQMEAEEARRAAAQHDTRTDEQIRLERERESLELSRKRILKEIEAATHPRHRQQLQAALAHLDERLKELA